MVHRDLFDLQRSNRLHQRVQRFILAHGGDSFGERHDRRVVDEPADTFDSLAIELARFQYDCETGVQRLYAHRGLHPDQLQDATQIPAVPTDAFKLHRVACHPAQLDEVVFLTSGTTIGTRGQHALRTTSTYRISARSWGKMMLFPDTNRLHWILLAPPYRSDPSSSLGFMLDDFANYAKCAKCAECTTKCSEYTDVEPTWAVASDSIDVPRIARSLKQAQKSGCSVIVAGASFAFAYLLRELADANNPFVGVDVRVMITGGFKGKTREIEPAVWRVNLCEALHVSPNRIVTEYGMTELSSQAYDGALSDGLDVASPNPVLQPPPWMRICPVDPVTLSPVPPGQEGIARIVDLANVDSAVAIQTADRVRLVPGGFELLGRSPGATPRGCSIGIDEILSRELPAVPVLPRISGKKGES